MSHCDVKKLGYVETIGAFLDPDHGGSEIQAEEKGGEKGND